MKGGMGQVGRGQGLGRSLSRGVRPCRTPSALCAHGLGSSAELRAHSFYWGSVPWLSWGSEPHDCTQSPASVFSLRSGS